MHTDYFTRMSKERDGLAGIATSYRSPLVRRVQVCKRSVNAAPVCFFLNPRPSVEQPISSRSVQIYKEAGINVELDDIRVTGISGSYKREQLTGLGFYYLVEDEGGKFFEADKIIGYDLKRNGLTWTLLLRRRK